MSLIAEIVTGDAAYLAACIERFKSATDGNVQLPLASAELLLRNYMRVLGQASQPEVNPIAQALSTEASMADLVAKTNDWIGKMKHQQEEAMLAMRPGGSGVIPPMPAPPTVPPVMGAIP